jgi:hypothetical protein
MMQMNICDITRFLSFLLEGRIVLSKGQWAVKKLIEKADLPGNLADQRLRSPSAQ